MARSHLSRASASTSGGGGRRTDTYISGLYDTQCNELHLFPPFTWPRSCWTVKTTIQLSLTDTRVVCVLRRAHFYRPFFLGRETERSGASLSSPETAVRTTEECQNTDPLARSKESWLPKWFYEILPSAPQQTPIVFFFLSPQFLPPLTRVAYLVRLHYRERVKRGQHSTISFSLSSVDRPSILSILTPLAS